MKEDTKAQQLQRFIDMTDGDVDLNKVKKQLAKQESSKGFVTAAHQFQQDAIKKGKAFGQDYNNYDNQKQRSINDYKQQQQQEQESATERLFSNGGSRAGLAGRRKFVPPTKSTSEACHGGGFQPGRSVQEHILKKGFN